MLNVVCQQKNKTCYLSTTSMYGRMFICHAEICDENALLLPPYHTKSGRAIHGTPALCLANKYG